jgi:hypothetical protein
MFYRIPAVGLACLAAASAHAAAPAAFTVADTTRGGCVAGSDVNCNVFATKLDVYLNGGPKVAGLADGRYTFAVIAPGHQAAGFIDGAEGNLSDARASATTGDDGSGDSAANRTFDVKGHAIVRYAGTHARGVGAHGQALIGLAAFDDTPNPGGVYVLAVCVEGATSPSQCKFDAFRVSESVAGASAAGAVYYDANANGQLDSGEVGIPEWPVDWDGTASGTVITAADGAFSLDLDAGSYGFVQASAGDPWMQTGNLVSQAVVTGNAQVTLNDDMTYDVALHPASAVDGLLFGDLCVGGGGGLTLGFWSNRNGRALVGADDLAELGSLHLRNADGTDFDPASADQLRGWLLGATAVNMANMLSAQLAAAELNVWNGGVDADALVLAPGIDAANANGFATVVALIAEADAALAADAVTVDAGATRDHQEALKNALDALNNDRSFVQAGPEACPLPVF